MTWQKMKLGDLIELKYGKALEGQRRNDKGAYPVYGANGVIGRSDEYYFDKPSIIVGRKGSAGEINLTESKFWPLDVTYYVVFDEKKCDLKFLFYLLRKSNLTRLAKGVKPGINREDVYRIAIEFPPLEDQKKIADHLDQADALRRKRKESMKLLDKYVESVFIEMFGDPVTNSKGWKKVKFGELGKLDRGVSKHRPRGAAELLGGEHPLIQTGDVARAGTFITDYKSTYSDLGLKQSKKWPAGTLCITIAANIADAGILTFDACFPDSVVGFVPDKSKTNNLFILFWLSFLKEMIEKNAPQVAQKNINLRILRDLEVIEPPVDMQNHFADLVMKVDETKKKMTAQQEEIESYFGALSQKAFIGAL